MGCPFPIPRLEHRDPQETSRRKKCFLSMHVSEAVSMRLMRRQRVVSESFPEAFYNVSGILRVRIVM